MLRDKKIKTPTLSEPGYFEVYQAGVKFYLISSENPPSSNHSDHALYY